jgi:hypothetical protein
MLPLAGHPPKRFDGRGRLPAWDGGKREAGCLRGTGTLARAPFGRHRVTQAKPHGRVNPDRGYQSKDTFAISQPAKSDGSEAGYGGASGGVAAAVNHGYPVCGADLA